MQRLTATFVWYAIESLVCQVGTRAHGVAEKKKMRKKICGQSLLRITLAFFFFLPLIEGGAGKKPVSKRTHHNGRQRTSLGDLGRLVEWDWPGVYPFGLGEARMEALREPPAVAVLLPEDKKGGRERRRRSRIPISVPFGGKRPKLDLQRRRGWRRRWRWRRRDARGWQADVDVDDNRRFWPLARLSPRESSRRLRAHEGRRGFFLSPGIPRRRAEPALAEGMRLRGELYWCGN